MIDPSGIAQLGEWVRTGGTVGVLAVLLGFWLKKRKDDREGWGSLIEALQKDIVSVRAMHTECEQRVTVLHAEVGNLRRMVIAQSSVRAVPLGDQSAMIRDAAERTAAAVLKDAEKNGDEDEGPVVC